ncbi:MAG TPA: TlpA disulfide reductase family protein [Gemmatimonadaceae bacterium]|jgi:thiol-disulfide isomerase/thioredoxin|nr:TlpA disulfide reductase family protein [Gemmatimonadaceae bacterium]
MKRRMKLASLAVLVAALVAPRTVRAQDVGISVGSKAPDAAMHTLDGKSASLAPYLGKGPVLIEFWATWCPNCKELEPAMKAAHAKYGARVKFVGIAVSVNENPARVKAFVAKYGIPGDQFFDTDGDATGKYDVPATSFVVVLDRTGKVVYTGLGGTQDLDAAIRKAL